MKKTAAITLALLVLASVRPALAAAAPAKPTTTSGGQVTLLLSPYRFHPVFAQTNNLNSTLLEFSAYDNAANPTNASSLKTSSKNTGISVPVYGLIKGLKTQIGTMSVSATGALTFLGF